MSCIKLDTDTDVTMLVLKLREKFAEHAGRRGMTAERSFIHHDALYDAVQDLRREGACIDHD